MECTWQEIEVVVKEQRKSLDSQIDKRKLWINRQSWKLQVIGEREKNLRNELRGIKSRRIKTKLKDNYRFKDREGKRSVRRDKLGTGSREYSTDGQDEYCS